MVNSFDSPSQGEQHWLVENQSQDNDDDQTNCKENYDSFEDDNGKENLSPRTAMENPSPAIEPAV